MSLISSLFSGVSGVRNHQVMMDIIGNNIANVNSVGFKGSRVTFSDTFNQFIRYGTDPSESSGGTNAYQVGLGVQVGSIDRDWNQGGYEKTGITTDLAVQGSGMFIMKRNDQYFYTRAGNLTFDAQGNLGNPQNGSAVQGKMATADGEIPPGNNIENIRINPIDRIPAVATTELAWGGNLSSTAAFTRTENAEVNGNIQNSSAVGDTSNSTSTIYDENGNAYTLSITYTKTADNNWDMDYDVTNSADVSVASGNNIPLVFAAGGGLDPATGINGAAPAAINVAVADLGLNFNLDARKLTQNTNSTTANIVPDNNRTPTIVNGTLTIYDSLGNKHALTIKFTKTSNNNWNWQTSVPETSGALSNNKGTVSFNSDGSLATISPNPPVLNFAPASGAKPQSLTMSLGTIDGFSGVTQSSANSVVSALGQNGSASAILSNVTFDQNGNVIGVYSNGFSRKLARIMLATFPNLNGLTSVGENLYTKSANSGEPFIGDPGENISAVINSGVLEQSNVDLSTEFTRMIISQRGFQANARVITVSDNLLQEITNLVR